MRCDRCKHWGTPYGMDLDLLQVRRCKALIQLWDAVEWNNDYERVLKPEAADQKAFVTDASWYSASLYTKADFFCAHFEEGK